MTFEKGPPDFNEADRVASTVVDFDGSVLNVPAAANDNEAPARKEEYASAEVDPNAESGKQAVVAAAEDNLLDQLYTYDQQNFTVAYHWDIDEVPAHPTYQAVDQLQQTLYGAQEVDSEVVQTQYNATKPDIWTAGEKAKFREHLPADADDQPASVAESLEPETSPARRSERERVDVFSAQEIKDFRELLIGQDERVTGLLGSLLETYPDEAVRPAEVSVYIGRLAGLKQQLEIHEDKLTELPAGALTEANLGVSYDDLKNLTAHTERLIEQVNEAITVRVDDPSIPTSTERTAAAEPAVPEVAAPETGRLNPESVNWGKVAYDAAHLVADIELDIGSGHSDTVKTAHYFLEQIEAAIAARPIAAAQALQALENLRHLHKDRAAYAAEEDDGLPNVYELQKDRAEARREAIVGPRRKKLTPEDLDSLGLADESIPIDTSRLHRTEHAAMNAAWDTPDGPATAAAGWSPAVPLAPDTESIGSERVEDQSTSTTATPESPTEKSFESAYPDAVTNLEKAQPATAREETQAEMIAQAARHRKEAKREGGMQKRVINAIDRIEGPAFGFLDRWVGDVSSPSTQLAEYPYSQFEALVSMTSKRDFSSYTQNEFPDLDMKYEAFQQWAPHLKQLSMYAARLPAGRHTTKDVIEGFVRDELLKNK